MAGLIKREYVTAKQQKTKLRQGFYGNLAQNGYRVDTAEIESIADSHAGKDGLFTKEE